MGKPCGPLLHPVGFGARAFATARRHAEVRVLRGRPDQFRDKIGGRGLVQARSRTLGITRYIYGKVEERGIAAAINGRMFDSVERSLHHGATLRTRRRQVSRQRAPAHPGIQCGKFYGLVSA